MPASRSRTERWRQSLQRIRDRRGGLEFTIDRAHGEDHDTADIVWRVRLIDFNDDVMILEHPGAMGSAFEIAEGAPLIGIMSVGQNRWMFQTKVLASTHGAIRATEDTLKVEMPTNVERCMRRAFNRTRVGSINLPEVDVYPLLDPNTTAPCESASRVLIEQLRAAGEQANISADPVMLPEVGPKFHAQLANIGGGGVGLVVNKDNKQALDAHHLFWLSVDLRPTIPAPLVIAARIAHTHIDSQLNTYAGLAFEFGHANDHKNFIIDQVNRFIRESHNHNATQKRAA